MTTQTNRHAEVHEVPDAVKIDSYVGTPLFIATIFEHRHILDTYEADTLADALAWARSEYGLTATVVTR